MASPRNQCRWGFEDDCAQLEKEESSVAHILAGCQWRYTFYNYAVLKGIVHEAQVMINQVNKEVGKVDKDSTFIFVEEKKQRKVSLSKYDKLGTLHEAKDWVMGVDVDQQLRFQEAVCLSIQRPDIIIYLLKLIK